MKDGVTISPLSWIFKTKWLLHQEIVWDRGSTHNKNVAYLHDQTERIYWLSKTNKPYYDHSLGVLGTIWRMNFGTKTLHPAPFCEELPLRCIKMCSRPGDVVLDCFCGSGTTGVAAKKLGRKFIGVEKHDKPENLPDAIKRIEATHNIESEIQYVQESIV
jgi:DNA modification methylase